MAVTEELVLDGNAVAGLLGEVFACEPTTAFGACSSCGTEDYVGASVVYVHAPGTVVRCRGCDNVLMVLVRQPGKYVISFQGLRRLEIRE
jgi:hypothetical protein